MIFGSKLLSSLLMSAVYLLKYLRYRQTKTSSGNVEYIQLWFGSPWCDPCLDPSPPNWVSTHTLETTALDQLANRCVNLRRQRHIS